MNDGINYRTPTTSIRKLKKHIRESAKLLPKDGVGVGMLRMRNMSPQAIRLLRNHLAAELWDLRNYPEDITIEEMQRLRDQHIELTHERSREIRFNSLPRERTING